MTSYAPAPGSPGEGASESCVKIADTRTGSVTNADYVGPDSSGRYFWRFLLIVPAGTPEGSWSLSLWAESCGGAVILSIVDTPAYLVDNTAPAVLFVTPFDGGNTMFATQRLAAKIVDRGLAGVAATSALFTLESESGSSTYPSIIESVTGWARTDPISLNPKSIYRIEVRAEDRAGNVTTTDFRSRDQDGGFRVVSATPGAPQATIPSTACSISEIDLATQTRTVTCHDLPLTVSASSVTLGATRHRGIATVIDDVDLTQARLVNPLVPAMKQTGNAWGTWTFRVEFEVPTSTNASSVYSVASVGETIPLLSANVPAAWTAAAVDLNVTASSRLDACADPTANSIVCTPDPVRSLPRIGTPSEHADVRGWYRAAPDGDGASAPMLAALPSWFTPSFAQQVRDADGAAVPLPAGAEDAPLPSEIGIRPGTWIMDITRVLNGDIGSSCTANFIFQNATGRLAIGTAGHCVEKRGDRVAAITVAPDTNDPSSLVIGTVILQHWSGSVNGPPEEDFALIRIDTGRDDWVTATAAVIGGPCSSYVASPAGAVVPAGVAEVGHGILLGQGGTPRPGLIPERNYWGDEAFWWRGESYRGDSGAPVRLEQPLHESDFAAVGIFTEFSQQPPRAVGAPGNEDPPPDVTSLAGPRIGKIISIIGQDLPGEGWTMLDSALCPAG